MRQRDSVLMIGGSTWGQHGGIQRFNRRVISSLDHIAARADILMLADPSDTIPDGRSNATGFGGDVKKFAYALARRASKYDVLLLAHINLLPFALLYKIRNPKGRVILFAHGIEVWGDPTYRKPKLYDEFLIKRLVDVIPIVSKHSQTLMAKAFNLSNDIFSYFPNAVDVTTERRITVARSKTILVVSRLGRNEAEKNVDKIISAFPSVLEKIPEARLHIVGDGELRLGLMEQAQRLGVSEKVRFAGFVTDEQLNAEYENAAVFALPSSKEGFGIVYLEAWIKGLPVIASRFGAGGEVVTHKIDGYTIDPFKIEDASQYLIDLLDNENLARDFADAGYNKVVSQYSGEAFTERLQKVIAFDGI